MPETFSVRLPKEQIEFLDNMAKTTDRSRNHLVSNAIARMKENYDFILRRIEEGDADFAAGRVVSHEEVMKRTQAIIDKASTG